MGIKLESSRVKTVVKTVSLLFLIGIIYYIVVTSTNLSIPCIFRTITGFKCPGCGITGMCINLINSVLSITHGDIEGCIRYITWAIKSNLYVAINSPLIIVYVVKQEIRWIKGKPMYPIQTPDKILITLLLIEMVIWFIVRNIFGI